MRRSKLVRILGAGLMVVLVGAACRRPTTPPKPPEETKVPTTEAPKASTDTAAAKLRTDLNNLLSEHVYLSALATGAALRGDTKAFGAWADVLNGKGPSNSTDLISAIGGAYGDQVQTAFDPLWRKHIGFVVSYTQGIAAGDKAKSDKAVKDLTDYAAEFGAVMESVNGLPKDTVKDLVMAHILTLKDAIDAQKAKDQPKVYSGLRKAYGHMSMIATPLAAATAAKTGKFPGDVQSAAAGLRAALNTNLREHVLLSASAAGAALRGDNAAFMAAADALNGMGSSNSTDLINAVGSVYGDQVKTAFDPLWRKHIGFVVTYVQGVGANDKAKSEKAVADLTAYAAEFGAVMESVNGLPKDIVKELVTTHILTLKGVIDDAKAGDAAKTATGLRAAVGHMGTIADPLAKATVDKFPAKFAS